MSSDFERALEAARRREHSSAQSQAQRVSRASQAAEQGYHQMLDIGRQAFNALAAAGCEEFALVEDYRNFKRADNVGIRIGSSQVGETDSDLYVCTDGRFLAGHTSLKYIGANQQWFSSEPKPRRIDGRRAITVHFGDWVGVSVRDAPHGIVLASYPPDPTSWRYGAKVITATGEMMTDGFGESWGEPHPFHDDVAIHVARVIGETPPR